MNLLRTMIAVCLLAVWCYAAALAVAEPAAKDQPAAGANPPDLAATLRSLRAVKAATLSSFTLAEAAPPRVEVASGCAVAGSYRVTGTNPGNPKQYYGTATVSERDGGCYMRWSAPNSSEGTGTYSNGKLRITFWGLGGGGGGIVVYSGQPGGTLSGTWWMHGQESNQGTETLTPN